MKSRPQWTPLVLDIMGSVFLEYMDVDGGRLYQNRAGALTFAPTPIPPRGDFLEAHAYRFLCDLFDAYPGFHPHAPQDVKDADIGGADFVDWVNQWIDANASKLPEYHGPASWEEMD